MLRSSSLLYAPTHLTPQHHTGKGPAIRYTSPLANEVAIEHCRRRNGAPNDQVPRELRGATEYGSLQAERRIEYADSQ